MARPQEAGLDYFGLPVNLFEKDELHFVIAKHGLNGRAVITSLLMRLFEVGYCFRWGIKDRTIFASKIGAPLETVETIVNDAINEGFFSLKLFESHSVLSSEWIQELYESATVKRKAVKWKSEFLLIKPKNANAVVSVAETPVTGDIGEKKPQLPEVETTQSKVKDSKEEESKIPPIPPKRTRVKEALVFPDWIIQNPILNENLRTWVDQRAKRRKPVSQTAIDRTCKKYEGKPDYFNARIDEAIRHDWQGIHEGTNGTSSQQIRKSQNQINQEGTVDAVKNILEKYGN